MGDDWSVKLEDPIMSGMVGHAGPTEVTKDSLY